MRRYEVASIPGDGIGIEVVEAARPVVDAVAAAHGIRIGWHDFDWGSDHYRRTGRMMPEDGIAQLEPLDAIFFGAVGDPEIPDDVTLWGLLIPMRRELDQYVNLRPVRSMLGARSPLVDGDDIDLVIVRENVEGEYSTRGGRHEAGTAEEYATQEAVFTRRGVERIARYAAELALGRRGGLTSATKSNGIIHTMPFWDEVVRETVARGAAEHAGGGTADGEQADVGHADARLELRSVLIDALAAELVLHPQRFDVIVASNLFGDILSDLATALVGSMGLAVSANIDPTRTHPSLFEPVHGSAPDIAGRGIANPLAQLGSAALMLDHLGEHAAAAALDRAIESSIREGSTTPDLGGDGTTASVAARVGELALADGQSC